MEKLARLPFSLTAFMLAPWPAPLIASALLAFGMGGSGSAIFFLLTLGVGLVISYLGTAALIVCLWFIGHVRSATKTISALAGIALALLGYVPFIFVVWRSSGPDSGPPEDSFFAHLLRSFSDPFLFIFTGAGLATALLYDFLARRNNKPRNVT